MGLVPTKPLTPTEVNAISARTLESSEVLALLAKVGVEGEVTNWKGPSKSGHFFFSIRDAGPDRPLGGGKGGAGQALPKGVANGMKVVAYGKISIWQVRGDYRFSVDRVEEAGQGELWAKVEATRRRLVEEGLLDPARKRVLPPFPRRIGIATSETGVVLHDVSTVLEERWPLATLVLRSVPVQGAGAGAAIAEGLLDLARNGRCDVILLCRGGGSAEDLMPFNEEVVARTIRRVSEEFEIPVVAGIGHAVDRSIADDAADAFGSVPAEAAALATPDRDELLRSAADDLERIARAANRRIDRGTIALASWDRARRGWDRRCAAALARLVAASRSLARNAPLARIERALARAAASRETILARTVARIERAAVRAARARERLEDLSPLSVLSRGYALVYDARANRLVRRSGDAPVGTRLRLRLAEGEIAAKVEGSS